MALLKSIADIRITVTNKDGLVLDSALVALYKKDTAEYVLTGITPSYSAGHYTFSNVSAGNYKVVVQAPSLANQERRIFFNGDRELTVKFVLGAANDSNYWKGGEQHPFTYDMYRIGVEAASQTSRDALNNFLNANAQQINKVTDTTKNVFLIEFKREVNDETLNTMLQELRQILDPSQIGSWIGDERTFKIVTAVADLVLNQTIRESITSLINKNLIDFRNVGTNKYILTYKLFPNRMFYDALNQIASLDDVLLVEARLINSTYFMSAPLDDLYPEQWHLPLINIETAWDELEAIDVDKRYGDSDLTIAVYDTGLESTSHTVGAEPKHPDFIGEVSSGLNKVVLFHDVDALVPDNAPNYNDPFGAHGTMVSSIVGALNDDTNGCVGVAPNTRLISVKGSTASDSRNAAVFEWLAGLRVDWGDFSFNTNSNSVFPPYLYPANLSPSASKAPVAINNSWGYGELVNDALQTKLNNALHKVALYGRHGRGTLNFFASGNARDINTNNPVSIETYGAHAAHEKTIAVGASSLDSDGKEIHAAFSYYGSSDPRLGSAIDFCAPSHDEYELEPVIDYFSGSPVNVPIRTHNPPENYAIVASHYLHGSLFNYTGNPSAPYYDVQTFGKLANSISKVGQLQTTLKSSAAPALSSNPQFIEVYDSSAFVPGQWLVIGDPYNTPYTYEIHKITELVSGDPFEINTVIPTFFKVKLQSTLGQTFAQGTLVSALSLQNTCVLIAPATNKITLTSADGFVEQRRIMIGDPVTGSRQFHTILDDSVAPVLELTPNPNGGVTSQSTPTPVFIVGGELRTSLTGNVNSSSSPVTLPVTTSAGFQIGQAVLIGNLGNVGNPGYVGREGYVGNDILRRTEHAMIVAIPSATSIQVDRLQTNHDSGTEIVGGRASCSTQMGGTSSASPQAAAIASLVLSVNKNLTWTEVRDILRRTAVPIDLERQGLGEWITPITPSTPVSSFTTLFTGGNFDVVGPSLQIAGTATVTAGTTELILSGSASGFALRQVVRIGSGINADLHVITGFDSGNPNKIFISALIRDKTGGDNVDGGKVAYYSSHLGFGRLDAGAAVIFAKSYQHDHRDLMIRDTLLDDGLSATSSSLEIESPDIWVRNIQYVEGSGSVEEVEEENLANSLSLSVVGPHQPALRSSDRRVYARIKNRGTLYPNLDAWVRFYLVLDGPGTTFLYPDHFSEYGNIGNGQKGVKLIGEKFIAEGTIPAGDDAIVYVDWSENLSDESTSFETNILVQVSPHDGIFHDAQNEGKRIHDNSNLSRRQVNFVDEVFFANDVTPSSKLSNKVFLPADALTFPVSSDFKIEVRKDQYFQVDQVIIKAHVERSGFPDETAYFKKVSGNWQLVDSSDVPLSPAPGWIAMSAPVKWPFQSSDLATGNQCDVAFRGSFTLDYTYKNLTLTAYEGTNELDDHKITVEVSYPNATGAVPSEHTKFYFFTDVDMLDPQDALTAFGRVNGSEQTQYRTTSRHKALTQTIYPNTDPFAYAVCDGKVLVQLTSDPNLVNVIIKPEDQGGVSFTNVKYFVYRGLKKSSFVISDNSAIVPRGTNPFIDEIWDDQDAKNRKIEELTGAPLNSITDEPNRKALGVHVVNAAVLGDDVVLADSEAIDQLFFGFDADITNPPVSKGMVLGEFDRNGFGFDIIVEGMGFVPTLEMIRGSEYIINAPVLTSPTIYQQVENNSIRARILNFIDPCAYYGLHYNNRVLVPRHNGNVDKYNKTDLYDNVITLFANKDVIYIDIRNENGYPFDYYRNYGDSIQIAFGASTTLTGTTYSTDKWPIKIIRENDISPSDPNNNSDKNIIRLSLPQADNTMPLVYFSSGQTAAQYPNQPKHKFKYLEPTYVTSPPFSDEFSVAAPNRDSLSLTTPSSWYIQLFYIKRPDPNAVAPNDTTPLTKYFFDQLFPLIDTTTWSNGQLINYRGGINTKYIENEQIGCVVDVGIAFEGTARVFLYATPINFFKINSEETVLTKRLTGGTSSKNNFFDAIKNIFPKLELKKRELLLSPSNKPYLTFRDLGSDVPKENVLILGMTTSEYQDLIDALALVPNPDAPPTYLPYSASLHYPSLSTTVFSTSVDLNDQGYYIAEFATCGLLDTTAKYVVNTAFAALETISGDGLVYTTLACAALDPQPIDQGMLEWSNLNKHQPGEKVYRLLASSGTHRWPLRNNDGTIKQFDSGEPYSGDIYLPIGTRVVLLKEKTLKVSSSLIEEHYGLACWYNGKLREGYISKYAIKLDRSPRAYDPASDNIEFRRSIIEAFVNDAEYSVEFAKRMHASEIMSSDPLAASVISLIDKTMQRVTGVDINNNPAPRPENSLRSRFNLASAAFDNGDSSLMDDLWKNKYGLLRKNFAFHWQQSESNEVLLKAYNTPVAYTINSNDQGKLAINYVKSISDFKNILPFAQIRVKYIGICIYGSPAVGSFRIAYGAGLENVICSADSVTFKNNIMAALTALGVTSSDVLVPIKHRNILASEDVKGFFPDAKELHFYRVGLKPESEINPADFAIVLNTSDPVDGEVYTINRPEYPPIMYKWLKKISQYSGLNDLLDHLSGIDLLYLGANGEVFWPNALYPNPSNGSPESGYTFLFHDLGYIWKRIQGNPLIVNDPEYSYLQQGAVPLSGSSGDFVFPGVDSYIYMNNTVWPDETYPNYDLDNTLEDLYIGYVPIDQSIGFINSNPIWSILLHESDQAQESTFMNDTHIHITDRKAIWDLVGQFGINYLNTYTDPAAEHPADNFVTFFQNQPGLALCYVAHYCDIMNINTD